MSQRSLAGIHEKSELSCSWKLFSTFESRQGRARRKLISNGRDVGKPKIDYPRNLEQLASFDEECQKLQNVADLANVSVDACAGSVRNLIQDKSKHNIFEAHHGKKTDSKLDLIVKPRKRARKKSQDACKSSSHLLSLAASLSNQLASGSPEAPLDKFKIAAILAELWDQNHREVAISGDCIHLGKYCQTDDMNMQQLQMSAKTFLDQIFLGRKFRASSDSRHISGSLKVSNLNNDLLKEILQEPNSVAARCINLHPSHTKKETVKSVLDATFSECESKDSDNDEKSGGNSNKYFQEAINSQRRYSSRTSSAAHPSNNIVILKPAATETTKVVDKAKSAAFSAKELKRKLKQTFRCTRKAPSHFSVDCSAQKNSRNSSTSKIKSGCVYHGVDTKKSIAPSANAKRNDKLCKKEELKSYARPDMVCVNMAREKLDISRVKLEKQEFDVVLEAKRHLSARLQILDEIQTPTSERSPRTLGRILSSPEHHWSLGRRRDNQYVSDSPQMRYNPYSTFFTATQSVCHITDGRKRTSVSPPSPIKEIASSVEYRNYDGSLENLDTKEVSSLLQGTGDGIIISKTDKKKSHEMPNCHDVAISMQMTDATELSNEDENITMHPPQSLQDSISENETSISTVDDFPSPALSIYNDQLDMADNIKYPEHQSPNSVLDPFFKEDDYSPITTLQTGQLAGRRSLQPLRLNFEECSSESLDQDVPFSDNACIDEQDYISQYVHLVLQASCLNWDQLSEISSPPEELLHASLFDELVYQLSDSLFDSKLLFDHINEVLLQIYQCHFCSSPWLVTRKTGITSVPLEKLVLDEVMKEADFNLLPWTEKRTLNQVVSKDVGSSKSWLNDQQDTEQVVIDVTEDIMDELILHEILDLQT